jgi:hypothetical protein
MHANCDAEARFRIVRWKLTGLYERKGIRIYRFWVTRSESGQGRSDDPVWVSVSAEGREWKVTDVSLYY